MGKGNAKNSGGGDKKSKAKAGEAKDDNKGKMKGAQSVNVRHILVCHSLALVSLLPMVLL
jgi:hypothetical protein